ncbi:bleomycin resistance protein [uncultured Eudoraea sp.]|uniref:VOC family protein n=1 Tax=uncultured Eudoraea sp. TaxID=1035614 RepID=UPI00261EE1DD|nr:bleomycin resistance protein [uncultured Eudoraea sp.]
MNSKFHLALPCINIKETRKFYLEILKAESGRSGENWLDINLYGNQLTFTQAGNFNFDFKSYRFGDHVLPSFHFGVIVNAGVWKNLYGRLSEMDLEITTEATFLKDRTGEHLSFFVRDPNDYMVEFKSFMREGEIFATDY